MGPAEIFLHIFLLGTGLLVSLPIWLAIFTSFKVPEDVTNYPPRLLPYQRVRVTVEGYDAPLAMFNTTLPDGSVTQLARVNQQGADVRLIEPDQARNVLKWVRMDEELADGEIFAPAIPNAITVANVNDIRPVERLRATFRNYITAWTAQPLFRYFMNSVIQTSVIVVFQIIFSIMAAYAFAILEFPGRNLLFYLILGSLMVPFQLTFIPNFLLVSSWGGANTYWGLTIPFLASAFGVFMLRQFFMTIPRDYHDSARIDGASSWRYLWQIVVPLSRGSISAFGVFSFLSAWSQYLWPRIITDEQNMRTLQIGVRFFLFDQERGADWGAIMATAVIALIPTLIIFLVAQRQLVKGIAMSGLKG